MERRPMTSRDPSGSAHDRGEAILVTGGSGFIGRQLVKKLADAGRTVVSMYHHRLPEPTANVYPVCSDLGSVELLAAPLRGVDTVVHLAWENNFLGCEEQTELAAIFDKSRNVRNLQNLLAAMEKAGTRRLIFLSANGTNRHSTKPFLCEKYVAEHVLLNSKIKERVIVRSAIVCGNTGHQDRFLRSIVNVMKFPAVYPVPKVASEIAPVHVDDLTDILSRLVSVDMDEPCALIDVAGGESFKIEDLFKLVSERYVKGARLPLKGSLGDSLLPLFEKTRKGDPSTPKLRDFLSLGNSIDRNTREANPLIGVLPDKLQSFKEVLKENKSL